MRWLQFGLGCLLAFFCLAAISDQLFCGAHYQFVDRGAIVSDCTVTQRLEGNGLGHWDSRGIRASGNSPTAAPGPTVLVLGDSQTEAMQVQDRQVFTSVAERLSSQPDWAPRLLNAAYGGLSAADFVRNADSVTKQFQPDWTVIMVDDHDFEADAWNDGKVHFGYVNRKLTCLSGLPQVQPFFDKLSCAFFNLPSQTRFASLNLVGLRRFGQIRARLEDQTPLFEGGRKSTPPPPPAYPLGQELELLQRAYSGRLTLVIRPWFWFALHEYSFNDKETPLRRLCREKGIRCVWMGDSFAELIPTAAPYGFPNTEYNAGHLNPLGHQRIGECLARELQELHSLGIL